MRNPFRRQTEAAAPSLRERAAELSGRLAEAIRRPEADEAASFPQAPNDLADACLWAIKHRAWIDRELKASDWSDEKFDGESAMTNAVFTRAINEPSTNLREITAKAALALEDFERFTLLPGRKHDDGTRIVHTVLREIVGVGREAVTSVAITSSNDFAAAILDGWAAWGTVQGNPDDSVQAEADARRRALIHAATALPAAPENITAKALACSWMEWVEAERPGQPRDTYGRADQLVFDLHAAIMTRGSQETTSRLASPAFDFGLDAHIAELAAEFCDAYTRNIKADRASMAGQIAEQEWLPHYEAAKALMERLEATEPKTMLGMALKCLGPIGAAGYNAPADEDEVQTDAWDRAGTELASAVLLDTLVPLPVADVSLRPVDLIAAAGLVLGGMSLRDIAALHDATTTLSSVVRAMQMQPRSWQGPDLNDVGKFTDWLGDQLDAQIDATVKELRAREPADWIERDIRLEAIAEATISNGDPAQTAAFARELLVKVGA